MRASISATAPRYSYGEGGGKWNRWDSLGAVCALTAVVSGIVLGFNQIGKDGFHMDSTNAGSIVALSLSGAGACVTCFKKYVCN